MRAFEHVIGGIANHLRGVDVIIMVQQACLVPAHIAGRKIFMVYPLTAQHGTIGGKEIGRRHAYRANARKWR